MTTSVDAIDNQLHKSTSALVDLSEVDWMAVKTKLGKTKNALSAMWGAKCSPLSWAIDAVLMEEEGDAFSILESVYHFDKRRLVWDTKELESAFENAMSQIREIDSDLSDTPFRCQLLGVELPLAIAMQLSKATVNCSELVSQTVNRFGKIVEELLDGDGWIKSDCIRFAWAMTASWARSQAFCKSLHVELKENAKLKLEWNARQFVRSIGPMGSQLLGPYSVAAAEFQKAVLAMSGDSVDKCLCRLRDPNRKSKKKDAGYLKHHDEAGFSQWAGTGVLHSTWQANSPRIALAINQQGADWEIANEVTLASDSGLPRLELNGKRLSQVDKSWATNCYHTDEDIEFLEVEYYFEEHVTLQRQFVLVREDELLLVADSVLTEANSADSQVSYTREIHVNASVRIQHEVETRELYLRDEKIRSLIIPLGLGEWKTDRTAGYLESDKQKLTYSISIQGKALYAPLVFDLNPIRSMQPRTWRQLTVGEDLEVVSKDDAVAYRVQVGSGQWVIYRSLTGGDANRTFIGENQICDFYIGRFDGDTECDELLQIG